MTFVLLTLIFLLGIFLAVKKFNKENQNLPPGPWGLPLLGHLVSLGFNPHLQLMKWKKKYGPIISCRFGSFPTVLLCDSGLIKEAFNMTEFSGRPPLEWFTESGGSKGLVLSEGRTSAELRPFAVRKLREFGGGRKTVEDRIHQGIAEFMSFVKTRNGQPTKSEEIPSVNLIRNLWSIMVKDELNGDEVEQLSRTLEILSRLGPVLSELAGFMPWLEKLSRTLSFGRFSLIAVRSNSMRQFYSFFPRFLHTGQKKRGNQVKGQLKGQTEGISSSDLHIMDLFLEKVEETTDESSPFHASQDSAKHFLGDLFAAGIHTIHTTLLWLLYFAAENPEVQLKLQEEIDRVTGSGNENDLSTSTSTWRLPSLSDRGQMPYAEALVYELLRMSSTLPFAAPHKVTTDVRFHGYTIKKDTMVFANVYGVHFDPEIWGDPGNFRPERWLGDSGQKHKNEDFLPFSTGRRSCLGEALARDQLFLYLTTLFQGYSVNFDLKRSKPKVKGVFGVTLQPSDFSVVFNERQT